MNLENMAFSLGNKKCAAFFTEHVELFRLQEGQTVFVPAGHGSFVLNMDVFSTFWIHTIFNYKLMEHVEPAVKSVILEDIFPILAIGSKFYAKIKEPFDHWAKGWKLLGGFPQALPLGDGAADSQSQTLLEDSSKTLPLCDGAAMEPVPAGAIGALAATMTEAARVEEARVEEARRVEEEEAREKANTRRWAVPGDAN